MIHEMKMAIDNFAYHALEFSIGFAAGSLLAGIFFLAYELM